MRQKGCRFGLGKIMMVGKPCKAVNFIALRDKAGLEFLWSRNAAKAVYFAASVACRLHAAMKYRLAKGFHRIHQKGQAVMARFANNQQRIKPFQAPRIVAGASARSAIAVDCRVRSRHRQQSN